MFEIEVPYHNTATNRYTPIVRALDTCIIKPIAQNDYPQVSALL